MRLDIVGGEGWWLDDNIDGTGFCNTQLIQSKPGHNRFCLSLDHDSFLDCLHFHGVPFNVLTDPKLGSIYKPWENQKPEVIKWIEGNREEFIAKKINS